MTGKQSEQKRLIIKEWRCRGPVDSPNLNRRIARTWSSLVVRDEGSISPRGTLLCLCEPQKIMQPMHGTIPNMFDCWANPVVHFLLLKSSIARIIQRIFLTQNLLRSPKSGLASFRETKNPLLGGSFLRPWVRIPSFSIEMNTFYQLIVKRGRE